MKNERGIEIQNFIEAAKYTRGLINDVFEISKDIYESKLFNYYLLYIFYIKMVPASIQIFLKHNNYKYFIYGFVIYVLAIRGTISDMVTKIIVVFLLMTNLYLFLEHGETLLNYL